MIGPPLEPLQKVDTSFLQLAIDHATVHSPLASELTSVTCDDVTARVRLHAGIDFKKISMEVLRDGEGKRAPVGWDGGNSMVSAQFTKFTRHIPGFWSELVWHLSH